MDSFCLGTYKLLTQFQEAQIPVSPLQKPRWTASVMKCYVLLLNISTVSLAASPVTTGCSLPFWNGKHACFHFMFQSKRTTITITHKGCILRPTLSNNNSKTHRMLTMCLVLLFTCINSFCLYNDSIMWVTIIIPCGSQSPYANMEREPWNTAVWKLLDTVDIWFPTI